MRRADTLARRHPTTDRPRGPIWELGFVWVAGDKAGDPSIEFSYQIMRSFDLIIPLPAG